MDGFLKIILTLGVSSVVAAGYLPTIPETNQNISDLAIACTDYYNNGSSEGSIFQLDGTEHGTLIDKDPTFQQLTFIIKETRCKKSEENINKPCAFKEDGVVKQCTASIFPGDGERKILVTCDTLYQNDKDPTFQQLTFIIKETRCKKSEENINKPCAFKEDGVVKQCTASIFPGDGERKILVTCDTLYQNNKKKRATSNPPCDCRCCYLKNNKCRRRPGCGGSIEGLDINI
ncbi:cathelicidin-related peptide Oh-Cath-like [Pelobates cultripes]|uniref:Cathelicidin-related peptide Oh-Cath-like n=1 Tax=Pelobates cultripes TaxID=61616 RepID=A0AAD1VYZ5_PELCU|nr:cathelicidin-related peptide Oh-Cath-like [Pelobates cultripes]